MFKRKNGLNFLQYSLYILTEKTLIITTDLEYNPNPSVKEKVYLSPSEVPSLVYSSLLNSYEAKKREYVLDKLRQENIKKIWCNDFEFLEKLMEVLREEGVKI